MAAKNSSPELRFGDWEDEDVDEFLSSECQRVVQRYSRDA